MCSAQDGYSCFGVAFIPKLYLVSDTLNSVYSALNCSECLVSIRMLCIF